MIKNENNTFIFDRPKKINLRYYFRRSFFICAGFVYKIFLNCMSPIQKEKKNEVAICAIFKNEVAYLREWIEYHLLIGVDHFYLYNNFSSDDYLTVLNPYIQKGAVTLVEWPHQQGQMKAYRDCIEKYSMEATWIGFLDIDEFVVPVRDCNIKDFLSAFKKRPIVLLYWKLFGSSGRVSRDISNPVIEDFTVCWPKYDEVGKCFFNTNYSFIPDYKLNSTFHHYMWGGYKGLMLPPVNANDAVCMRRDVNPQTRNAYPAQVNHYFTKSFDEYNDKKSKGDVFHKINPHDEAYFFRHEMLCSSSDYCVFKYITKLKLKLGRK